MPGRICIVHRISRAIPITIQPTLAKRAPTVGAVKAHQLRVVGPITLAEQITPGRRIEPLALKTQQSTQPTGDCAVTIGRVGQHGLVLCGHTLERRPLTIGNEQDSRVTLLFGQYLAAARQQAATLAPHLGGADAATLISASR